MTPMEFTVVSEPWTKYKLEDQTKLFALLDPARIGVTLSEEFQLEPEQSTSAIIVHHAEAKYFSID